MKGKICSNGECHYRTMGNGFYGCSYESYCDFQRPRDSQTITYSSLICTCGSTSSSPCPIHGMVK